MTEATVERVARDWTVWDAEAHMARDGDWRGVAYSIAHDILPKIAEGSPDHAYQERARMQIKAADRLCAAIAAMPTPGEWRPMAEAERDCVTERDFWCEGLEGDGWLLRGRLNIGEPVWIVTNEGDYFPHENGGWITHWRPVPAPPVDRQPLPPAPVLP